MTDKKQERPKKFDEHDPEERAALHDFFKKLNAMEAAQIDNHLPGRCSGIGLPDLLKALAESCHGSPLWIRCAFAPGSVGWISSCGLTRRGFPRIIARQHFSRAAMLHKHERRYYRLGFGIMQPSKQAIRWFARGGLLSAASLGGRQDTARALQRIPG